jgi:hypothetical protein
MLCASGARKREKTMKMNNPIRKTLLASLFSLFAGTLLGSCADLTPDLGEPAPPVVQGPSVDRTSRVPGEDTAIEVLRGISDSGLCALLVKAELAADGPAIVRVYFRDVSENRSEENFGYESLDVALAIVNEEQQAVQSVQTRVRGFAVSEAEAVAARVEVTLESPNDQQLSQATEFKVSWMSAMGAGVRHCRDLVLTKP